MDLIADMMMKDPAARIQSAREVIRRLEPWAGKDPVRTAAIALQGGTPPVQRAVPPAPLAPAISALEEQLPLPETVGSPEPASQTSQGTLPVASATEETFAGRWSALPATYSPREPLPKGLKLLIAASIVAVVLTLVGIVVLSLL